MKILTVKNMGEASRIVAEMVAGQIKGEPNSVIGFATGSSPIGAYKRLVEMYDADEVNFSRMITFNLDEYCGLGKENPQSYYYFMMEHLFGGINVDERRIDFPDGLAGDYMAECARYEQAIKAVGGIDLQILGIGHNGHIGFNEPGSAFDSRTREVALADETVEANKRFFDSVDDVPKTALSMGIGTIMDARKIVLIAGPGKREIIEKLRTGVVSEDVPASILHEHADCTIVFAEMD
jgi:glucosamine-6-phosphate deaminase